MNQQKEIIGESLFKIFLKTTGFFVLGIPTFILIILIVKSYPSMKHLGFSFFTTSTWNPVKDIFGGLPFLAGTLITSLLALAIAVPFSISVALIVGEYLKPGIFTTILKSTIELLAGIPSVIYGFWGLLVLVPLIRNIEVSIGAPPYGVGIITASIILSIMIIPYASSVAREAIQLVPSDLKEAAYSLGATRLEVIKRVVLQASRSGIIAGIFLALGRALGETMAVTMVIGNSNRLTLNIFEPANTMASVLANEFTEAVGDVYLSSLVELGLLLFVVSTVINIIGRMIASRMQSSRIKGRV